GAVSADGVGTDAQGRFRLLVPKWVAERHARRLLVMKDRRGVGTLEEIQAAASRPVRQARVELPLDLPKGDHELGDVVFKVPPLVASGLVLDEAGRPVPKAYVSLSSRTYSVDTRPDKFPGENTLGWVSTESAPDGSFELRGFVHSDFIV